MLKKRGRIMDFERITSEEIAAGRRAILDGWSPRPNLIVTKTKAAKIWDDKGKEYIDCTSQAWSLNIGALHPAVTEAIRKQFEKMSHVAFNLDTLPLLLLAKKLAELAPGDLNKVNFCLEGSLAVEGAMKLAMKNKPERRYFVTFDHSYHGRSLATIAASWNHPYNSFLPYMQNVIKVPEAYCYTCAFKLEYPSCDLFCARYLEDTLENRVNGGAIALMMEPVQGNGGQISFPEKYYQRVRQICNDHDVLLIWDEVQTGFGRTGEIFAADLYKVVPDVLVFGKGIGGGFPLAGIIARENLRGFDPGEHAFTFGAFPLSMVAALATIAVLEQGDLLDRCRKLNKYITNRLLEMKKKYEIIGDVRGPGLAIGIELVKDRETKEPGIEEANDIVKMALEKGIILGISKYGESGHVLKIKPALVITDEEVEKVLSIFEECISKVDKRTLSK